MIRKKIERWRERSKRVSQDECTVTIHCVIVILHADEIEPKRAHKDGDVPERVALDPKGGEARRELALRPFGHKEEKAEHKDPVRHKHLPEEAIDLWVVETFDPQPL